MHSYAIALDEPILLDLTLWSTVLSATQRRTLEQRWLVAHHRIRHTLFQSPGAKRMVMEMGHDPLILRLECSAAEGGATLYLLASHALAVGGNVTVALAPEIRAMDAWQYHTVHEAMDLLGEGLTQAAIRQSSLTLTVPDGSRWVEAVFVWDPACPYKNPGIMSS